ncbi:MAG: cation transporter, partial [Prochloraceae cyanobacterium]
MNSQKLEKFALKLSVFGTPFLTILGISFGLWIQSEAIILDGFFNLISLIMALASLWVSWLISQPASKYFQFDYLNFIPLVNLIKGLLIVITSLLALILSIITIFNGGRNLDSQIAVLYAIIAAITCSIIAVIQRYIAQKNSSTMVIVDSQNWLINGLISLALVIAFSFIRVLENSAYNWFL